MIVSKKDDELNKLYVDLTKSYLSCMKDVLSEEDLVKYQSSTYLISEGYRNALCILFGLKTEASTFIVKKYEFDFARILRPVYDKYNIHTFSLEKKKGLLEACIHCIEMSRKLVDVD